MNIFAAIGLVLILVVVGLLIVRSRSGTGGGKNDGRGGMTPPGDGTD